MMKAFYSENHRLRDAKTELDGGLLIPPFECPRRADIVLAEWRRRRIGEVVTPAPCSPGLLATVHRQDYLDFLGNCVAEWQNAGHAGEVIANCWPSRAMPRLIPPKTIDGRVGYYALSAETSISPGTWEAALSSASSAVAAADAVRGGQEAAFALCRPPGHHAATDMFGGYCFLNNAALAAQRLLDDGASRIAVLDVDFHHGNGTQEIFYHRRDVLFLSLHGDPAHAFPHFLGYADETGAEDGDGFNANYPMPPNTGFADWHNALRDSVKRIVNYAPEAVVVSLGLDTFRDDPISFFKLDSEDFLSVGDTIGKLKLPTVFLLEGGYAVDALGVNTVNVLEGFENA